MRVNECKYISKLHDEFLNIYNERYTQDKYYKVIISECYDTYEGEYFDTTTKMCIDLTKMREVVDYGFWGNARRVNRVCSRKEEIGVYAVKRPDGIHEMVTDKKLYIAPANDYLCCFGLEPLTKDDVVKASEDLKILDTYPVNKKAYINAITSLSNIARKKYAEMQDLILSERQKPIIEAQAQADAIQYLKSYRKPPRN